jgi:alkanesulfonate monooxygenase SsuD/methylene tetrahydromethanopterin reductase-like flavin-dependent oxidoreductase (luciferase family)
MVTSATFRHPGPLAISVAQVDEMSGGRVEFGIGAGWFEAEHRAYAIPFPPLGERFDRLTEQLEILTGLWTTPAGDTFDYSGAHYSIAESPGLPKPVQTPHPPIILGGMGAKRTPALTARFATEFNIPFAPLDGLIQQYARVAAAVEEAGRAKDSLTYSAAFVLCAGRDDAEIARRAAAIGREVDELRSNSPAVGTPDEIVDKLGPFLQGGVQRVYLQVLDMSDLEHIEFIAETVVPQLR